ncbi:unnamed protein product [Pylaiella littoralis]
MAGETMFDGGSLIFPPPPTFRAPTRDSVLAAATRGKRSSTIDEDDLSFMDKEIKRLHRDMANMLARETPSADDKDNCQRALSTTSALHGGRGKRGAVVISRATSPAGDSDFDYSDDDDGIAILKDDLRTTTERFFERLPRQGQEQQDAGRPNRRASATLSFAHDDKTHSGRGGGPCVGLRQQQSWNALQELEKDVGGMMRRHAGAAAASMGLHPPDGGGSSGGGDGWTGLGGEAVSLRRSHDGGDPFSGCRLGRRSRLRTSSFPPSTPPPGGGGGREVTQRRPPRDNGASVSDLKARSEEAARMLKALKILLEEEGFHSGDETGDGDTIPPTDQQHRRGALHDGDENGGCDTLTPAHQQRRKGACGLWPSCEGEDTAEVSPSSRVDDVGGAGGGIGSGSDGDPSRRMKLLLVAMDNLQQINTDLKSEVKMSRRRTTGGREGRDHRRQHRHSQGASSSLSRPIPGGRCSFGQRRLLQAASVAAHPRSSSDLLRNRRSEKGQAEPMSCGVPRHRVQVSRGGDNNIVYYELAITQAKSTWTLERRLDEFVELRRSLVATATDLAAAAAVADRERQAAQAGQKQFGRRSFSSSPCFPADVHFARSDDAGGGGGGERSESGVGRNLAEARREYRRQAEVRVPELPPERNSWFDSSSIWSVLYGRKREEKLTEMQVHLASWLASVLADRELLSTDLVCFLGGDSGGVQAQPVVEDVVPGDDESDGDDDDLLRCMSTGSSWSSSSCSVDDDVAAGDGDDDNDDDTDDNFGSDELNDPRGSLFAPEERDIGKRGSGIDSSSGGGGGGGGSSRSTRDGRRAVSPRDRLEKAMYKRLAVEGQARAVGEGEGPRPNDVENFTGVTARMSPGEEVATDEEGEGEDGEEAQSLRLKEEFSASVDASRQPRAPSPSPASPTRRVTLDSFFQAPT